MIRAVIFDLDGVLVSTDELHFKAWKRLADEIGIKDFNKEDNIRQRGIGRMESLDILLEKTQKQYSYSERITLAERKNDYYKEYLTSLTPSDVLDGAKETLEKLKNDGIKTVVGSASQNAPVILEKAGLLPLLDAVACGLDVTRSKPDPQIFLVAADKVKIPYKNCIVIEDSDAGIAAAKAAGMYAFAVGSANNNSIADFSAENLAKADLKTIIGSNI